MLRNGNPIPSHPEHRNPCHDKASPGVKTRGFPDLRPYAAEVARALLGEENRAQSTPQELRFGTHGGVSVVITGPDRGKWFDHEAGIGGGVWKLVKIKGGMSDPEAAEWLGRNFGVVFKGAGSLGSLVATYDYRDEHARLLFQVCRFEPKRFLQRRPDGNGDWVWNLAGVRRVLYRLPELVVASLETTVWIVEGEKDVDRLVGLGLVSTTNPGGAAKRRPDGRPGKSRWRPEFNPFFAGRDVVIIPDNDDTGRDHSQSTGAILAAVAARVRILELPGLPQKGDDVSVWLDAGGTRDELERLAASAPPFVCDQEPPEGPCYISFTPYEMTEDGLFFVEEVKVKAMRTFDGEVVDSTEEETEERRVWLSSPFAVLAKTRDNDGNDWGVLLRWADPDGRAHEWPMPRRLLRGHYEEIWGTLLDRGIDLAVASSLRNRIAQYLSSVKPSGDAISVSRIGWHTISDTAVFVLPDKTYGEPPGCRVLWQHEAPSSSNYRVSGTLGEWRERIGAKCVGNAKLMTCVSMAFAGPLLDLANEPGGGIHLVGTSQFGKTITQIAAGSVWGGGDIGGFLETWRATANGLEGVAEAHCDTFLPLNELGEVAPREAGETAYMLANGSGKSRARRDGSTRRRVKWRILFLSSGEISLAEKMSEAGKRPRAGQEVRLADIGADAGAGYGIFTELHGAASSGAFAEELRLNAMSC